MSPPAPAPGRDIPAITERLRAASVVDEAPGASGGRWVRAYTACRIIGVRESVGEAWERDGRVRGRRIRVPVCAKATRGVIVLWPLEEAIACARAYRPQRERSWSTAEDDALLGWLGVVPTAEIARRLDRPLRGVQNRAEELGVNRLNAQGELTTGEAARLCGRTRERVRQWVTLPPRERLPHRRCPGGKGEALIRPDTLARWLRSRPAIWKGLSPAARRRLDALAGSPMRRAA